MSELSLTDEIRKKLAEVDPESGKTYWELMVAATRERAAAGDAQCAKIIKSIDEGQLKGPSGDPPSAGKAE